MTAFVLKYRLPSDIIMKDKTIGPLQDAREAMRFIRRNASELGINPTTVGVMGFSAGGHLAAKLSTHYKQRTYETKDETSARPDFSILIYPVISMKNEITYKGSKTNLLSDNPSDEMIMEYSNELHITENTFPAFIIHACNDKSVHVENSIQYFIALKKNNVPVELHIYEKVGHGFGLGINGTSKSWTLDCEKWLKSMNIPISKTIMKDKFRLCGVLLN